MVHGSRRTFLQTAAGGLGIGIAPNPVSLLPKAAASTSPIHLGSGPHLFVDDFLVTRQDDLIRTLNHPTRLPRPVVTSAEGRNWQPWMTALRDAATRRFRIWYNAWDGTKTQLGYMEPELCVAAAGRVRVGAQ